MQTTKIKDDSFRFLINITVSLLLYKMKYILATVASIALSAGVISNAYYQKKQFYPSVVYITKSSPSMAVCFFYL